MTIAGFDHLVLTVQDINRTARFYEALGFISVERDGRTALRAGVLRINLHPHPSTIEPRAEHPTVGSADFCIVTTTPVDETIERLASHDIAVELGPVARHGARGEMVSVYVRDPDRNLVELAFYPG